MGAPSGTVTFLFTDIEGSTRLWESAPELMTSALARHDEIVRAAIEGHGGFVFSTGGDGFAAAFARVVDASAAATGAQAGLATEPWPDGVVIRVRMGLHTGEADERGGDYFGPAVNRAARLMAVAHGGQVVCSQATAALMAAGVEVRLLGAHRLRDLAAAEQVFQVGSGAFPPLRSVDVVPTNLPTMRTELIGRSEDIAAVSKGIEEGQLVTLTGVGGVGKTRLALAVAAALAPRFPDGCWLVELAPVPDGGDVLKTVAATMGAPVTHLDSLVAYLADRRMLVVLDNCEHVLDAVAELVDAVLRAAPEIHVITTSREPLGLDGESVRRVPSLEVPPSDADADLAANSSAVRLFAERAASARDRFTIGPANIGAVVEICRHLDGIPLAIELAAARAVAMPPGEIAARLGERFRLLAGGSRRAQERHRTLLAAVSWSHDLLDEDEKVVFRRLAVFPASFDLPAAEAVVGAPQSVEVVDIVGRLVARSLLQYEDDTGRYRLLETLRQYGADRLAEAEETDPARQRHARYFLDLAERLGPELGDARYPSATAAFIAELDSLRGMAEWCVAGGRWFELATLVDQLLIFLIMSAPVDGTSWIGHLIEHADDLDPQVVVDSLGEMAYIAVTCLGDYPGAVELAEGSLRLSDCDGVEESPLAWVAKSIVAFYTDRDERGLGWCEHSMAIADSRGDDLFEHLASGFLEVWLVEAGDTERAAQRSAEHLRRAEKTQNPAFIENAVVTAASMYLYTNTTPDFAASMAILARHPERRDHDDAIAMWVDIAWGATLVGLHDNTACKRLAAAVHLAYRLSALHAQDLGLRLLAIAAANAGHEAEAATLHGYTEANLSAHRLRSAGHAWVQDALERSLAGVSDRSLHEARGAVATRRQIMALVTQLDTTINHQPNDQAQPIGMLTAE